MKKLLYGLAALPFLAGVALAETPRQSNDSSASAKQPMQLSEKQMDKVTAGFGVADFLNNTSSLGTRFGLPANFTYVAPIVAEDTVFQGVTHVTTEQFPSSVTIFLGSGFGLTGP